MCYALFNSCNFNTLSDCFVDRDVLRRDYLGCHPCINTSSLRLKMTDVKEKLIPALHHTPVVVELPWEDTPRTNPL